MRDSDAARARHGEAQHHGRDRPRQAMGRDHAAADRGDHRQDQVGPAARHPVAAELVGKRRDERAVGPRLAARGAALIVPGRMARAVAFPLELAACPRGAWPAHARWLDRACLAGPGHAIPMPCRL